MRDLRNDFAIFPPGMTPEQVTDFKRRVKAADAEKLQPILPQRVIGTGA